jgi:uncharacterized protein YchJ
MHFLGFNSIFPKIAEHETRSITVLQNGESLPIGEYSFIELYCADKKCDCRRVMMHVFFTDSNQVRSRLAVLSFGWEPKAFYRKWAPNLSDDDLKYFKGPDLDPHERQTSHSERLLECFKIMLNDGAYRQRIIRHYVQFKQKTGMKMPKDLEGLSGSMQDCGCKSGLKFRVCCGAKK